MNDHVRGAKDYPSRLSARCIKLAQERRSLALAQLDTRDEAALVEGLDDRQDLVGRELPDQHVHEPIAYPRVDDTRQPQLIQPRLVLAPHRGHPRGTDIIPGGSGAPEVVGADRQPPDPLPGRREDRVAHGRGEGWDSGLTDAAGRFLARPDVYLDLERLVDPHDRVERRARSRPDRLGLAA